MRLNVRWFLYPASEPMMPHSLRPHPRKVLAASLFASTVVFFLTARQYGLKSVQRFTDISRQASPTILTPHIRPVFPITHTLTVTTQPNLRILPLGDSITYGFLSTSGNGYRSHLFDLLNATYPSVTYIGSQYSGNMTNNANEGHPGYLIHDIAKEALQSLVLQPNVILLMAGTNDMALPYDPADAPWRLAALLDFTILMCPYSLVLVAQLGPVTVPQLALELVRKFNEQVPKIVEIRQKAGKKVMMVNMSQNVMIENLRDGVHPTDEGYDKIAQTWYYGIQAATQIGWIWEPAITGRPKGISGSDPSQIPLRPEIRDGRTCEICI